MSYFNYANRLDRQTPNYLKGKFDGFQGKPEQDEGYDYFRGFAHGKMLRTYLQKRIARKPMEQRQAEAAMEAPESTRFVVLFRNRILLQKHFHLLKETFERGIKHAHIAAISAIESMDNKYSIQAHQAVDRDIKSAENFHRGVSNFKELSGKSIATSVEQLGLRSRKESQLVMER